MEPVKWLKLANYAIILVFCITSSAFSATTLFDWNHPSNSGTTWNGWTWYPSGANDYGAVGWRKDDGRFYSGDSNWYPRIHEKTDYGTSALGAIDLTELAPNSSSGGSLKIYDDGTADKYQASYWYMFGDSFGTNGLADSTTNRLSFYFKTTGAAVEDLSAYRISNGNMHFGTYLCWEGGGSGYPPACPNEGPNQHYYHYLTLPLGTMPWIHIQLDQHPTHRRGGSEPNEPDNNPAFVEYGKNYFENMNSFYFEIRAPQANPTTYWVDEMILWTQTQEENEDSIGSNVWVGYWPTTDKWQMGFGSVWPGRPMQATFEVRWSTTPITNANYDTANVAEPEYRERGTSNTFTLDDKGWRKNAWTQFEIPDEVEASVDKIYFAIRDVSSTTNGDGYNSPTTNIKTIDYVLSNRMFNTQVLPPSNLLLK